MPPDSEIVCPFCGHCAPLTGDPSDPSVLKVDDYFLSYTCPCGAIGSSKEWLISLEAVPDDTDEIICEWWRNARRPLLHLASNYATHTEPPMLLLWAKRRASPRT
jgi:hypothetical protein